MTSPDRRIDVEIRPPFLTIRANDVRPSFRRRRDRGSGPFLIISVTSGLALDTAFGTAVGDRPHLWGPHGKPHQLWYLAPSGHAGEVFVVSAANGLVLDGGHGAGEGHHPQMRANNAEAWQRWQLRSSPDQRAHVLTCVGLGTVLDCPWDAKWQTRPVMWRPSEGENQQWLLALPFAAQRP